MQHYTGVLRKVRYLRYFTFASLVFLAGFFLSFDVGQAANAPDIQAEAVILIDADSGKILYEKNADTMLPPASMTKMMTEYLILEAIGKGEISWDQEVPISDYTYRVSQNYNLSNVPLLKDVNYTVREIYEAMVIYSANGATIALAELVAGSEKEFVNKMNEKAKELGLTDAKFVNSTGLNNNDLFGQHPAGSANEENMMSARSTALLAYRLLKDYPDVLETASIPKKEFTKGLDKPLEMLNWNWMLEGLDLAYPGVDGLKTGSTELGGFSFTGTAEKDGMRLISVVMKTDSYIARFRETAKLFDFGFNNFSRQEIVTDGFQIKGESLVPVVKGKEKEVEVEAADHLAIVVENGEEDQYEPVYQFDESKFQDGALAAPVKKDEKVGSIVLQYRGENESYGYITGENGASVDLVAADSVEKAGWFRLGLRSIGNAIGGLWNSLTDTVAGWF